MKNQRPKRIFAIMLLLFCLFVSFSQTAYAAPNEKDELIDREDIKQTEPTLNDSFDKNQLEKPIVPKHDYLREMNRIAMFWYKTIRNYIAIPLMILSFATCGYKFFMCAFMGKPEYAIDGVKKQFFNTVIALFVLFLLPVAMTIARNLTESTQWTPPGSEWNEFWNAVETIPAS